VAVLGGLDDALLDCGAAVRLLPDEGQAGISPPAVRCHRLPPRWLSHRVKVVLADELLEDGI
jgi:hypothetical protein